MSDIENVKRLREATGAGFKDCNNAIKESGGDIDKAIEILRVKGISKASKKMSRDAKEGVVAVSGNETKTSVIDKEQELVTEELKNSGKPEDIAKKISLGKMKKFKEENSLLTQAWVMEPKKKVQDIIKELSIADLKIKEFYRIKIGE